MANDHDLEKYSRQIILNEIGHEGQKKIKRVSILVIGAGGLGSSSSLCRSSGRLEIQLPC